MDMMSLSRKQNMNCRKQQERMQLQFEINGRIFKLIINAKVSISELKTCNVDVECNHKCIYYAGGSSLLIHTPHNHDDDGLIHLLSRHEHEASYFRRRRR